MRDSSEPEHSETSERGESKAVQLRWLAINALGGTIMGLLIYYSDALVRLAIRPLM
ncbi:hypothetical protein D3C83_239390 [compost metagenome]